MSSNPHAVSPVIQAGAPIDTAELGIVLLHGRGGSAQDILGLASAFSLPDAVYFAPQAAGHTWYPLSFMAPREANEPYLSSALRKVENVVQRMKEAGIERNRIVIAGFSQGACLATEFVASHPARYAGLIAFTGGLIGPAGDSLTGSVGQNGSELAGTPALFLSGDPDPHVPWSRVEQSGSILRGMGAAVTARRFPGRPHTISAEEVQLAREFLNTVGPQ